MRVALRYAGPAATGPTPLERLVGISATPCGRDAVHQHDDQWVCIDHWIRLTEDGRHEVDQA